jgi:hypothetical protein
LAEPPREIDEGPEIEIEVPDISTLSDRETLPACAVTVTVLFLGSLSVVRVADATPA